MDLQQLRVVVAIARLGNLTRASERLHLSQPAVSAQLKAAECELGLRLFERTPSGMVLTSAGRRLLERAEHIVGAMSDLLAEAHALRGEVAGRMRLGTIIDPEFLRLGTLLRTMVERHPLIEIETCHGISGWVIEQVGSGNVDAGFCLGEIGNPELAVVQLASVPYRIVAPPSWSAAVGRAEWSQVAAMPWIWTTHHSSHNRIVCQLFDRHGLAPGKRVVVADQEATMRSLVSAGVGLSIMREDLAEAAESAGELCIWRAAAFAIPLSFIHLAARSTQESVRALADAVRDTWGLRAIGWSEATPPMQAPEPLAIARYP